MDIVRLSEFDLLKILVNKNGKVHDFDKGIVEDLKKYPEMGIQLSNSEVCYKFKKPIWI